MKLIFCVITLVAIVSRSIKANSETEQFQSIRHSTCYHKTLACQKQMTTVVTTEEIMALCKAKPLNTTATKCLIDCQMRQYNWINISGFQKRKYMAYVHGTNEGFERTYQRAASKAADYCKDKKAAYEDSCETAYLIMQCLQDEGDKEQQSNLGYAIFYVPPYFPFELE